MSTQAPWLAYQNAGTPPVDKPGAGPWTMYSSSSPATPKPAPSAMTETIPPAMTAPKLSDFTPDWATPGKFAKGVGEGAYGIGAGILQTVLHPVQAIQGAGQGFKDIKNDLADRQYISALADTLNLAGVNESKAAELWNEGRGAEAAGQATTQGLAAYYGAKGAIEKIPDTVGAIRTGILDSPKIIRSLATAPGRQALLDSASAVRDTVAARTQQMLRVATNVADSHVSRLVRGINAADDADIAARGINKAGIDTKPFTKGLDEAQNIYRQVGQKMPGVDTVANRISQWGGTKITFEQAKQLRTDVGGIMEHATGAQREILSSTYDDLTDAMKTRAESLGQTKQFNAYNKIHSVIRDYQNHGLLGNLLTAKDSGAFYNEIAKRGNRASILKLQNTLKDYGLQPDALDASLNDVKSLHQFLESHNAGSFIGIFRKLSQHPVGGGLGFAVGGLTGNYLTRIFGTWAGAALAERIAVIRALDKLGVPIETGSDIGDAAKVLPKGATIGEQMAAKGQTPLEPGKFNGNGKPRFIYRGTAAGENGIEGAPYDQASESIEEARDYARMKGGNVQRIDLSKLDPNAYEIAGGMNTPNLYRFKGSVPPEAIEQIESHPAPKNGSGGAAAKPVPAEESKPAPKVESRPTPSVVSDEEKEEINRGNRVRETVQVARQIDRGEKELARIERMKQHLGPKRYEEAIHEISRRLDILRAQVAE